MTSSVTHTNGILTSMGMVAVDIETTMVGDFFGADGALELVSTWPSATGFASATSAPSVVSLGVLLTGAVGVRFILARYAAAWLSRVSLFLVVIKRQELVTR